MPHDFLWRQDNILLSNSIKCSPSSIRIHAWYEMKMSLSYKTSTGNIPIPKNLPSQKILELN